jgi:hypothetical protein
MLFLWFFQNIWNKEIVRERFFEMKNEMDFVNTQLNNQGFQNNKHNNTTTPVNLLFDDSYRFANDNEKSLLFYIFSYGLLFSSPDYDTILQTGLYYEGEEPNGFYNSETFMDSIKNIYYIYSVSDVQWQ